MPLGAIEIASVNYIHDENDDGLGLHLQKMHDFLALGEEAGRSGDALCSVSFARGDAECPRNHQHRSASNNNFH